MTTTTSNPIERWLITIGSAMQASWPPLAVTRSLADLLDRRQVRSAPIDGRDVR